MTLALARKLRTTVTAGMMLCLWCGAAVAEPALWVAKGRIATVYLFGTIHVLREGQTWKTPAITRALASSRELWLEIADPDDPGERQALLSQLGFDPPHPLSTKLTREELARLDAVAKAVGMAEGEKMLEPMQPWLASLAISNAFIARAGYDPQSGIERILLRDEAKSGKTVNGFESLRYQLRFFADMEPPLQLDMVRDTLRDFDKGPAALDALVECWLRGDVAAATRYGIDDMKHGAPALYRVLLVQRNQAWADQIAAMLNGFGVSFVAVGFLHFAGPDSVLNALAQRGIKVERVAASP